MFEHETIESTTESNFPFLNIIKINQERETIYLNADFIVYFTTFEVKSKQYCRFVMADQKEFTVPKESVVSDFIDSLEK